MKKLYRFAEEIFEIDLILDSTVEYLKEYEVFNVTPKYKISYTMDELYTYKEEYSEAFKGYDINEVENSYVYGRVGTILTLQNKFIIHGSSIYLDSIDNAYLLTAPSGTGKSTHSRLLKKLYGDRIQYINDDKPLIYNNNGVVNIYGSPWNGKERISNNVKCNLKGIFIVERGNKNIATKISPNEAINYLIRQLFMPIGKDEASNALKCLVDLCMNIPVYILNVDMSDDAPKASYKIMNKEN